MTTETEEEGTFAAMLPESLKAKIAEAEEERERELEQARQDARDAVNRRLGDRDEQPGGIQPAAVETPDPQSASDNRTGKHQRPGDAQPTQIEAANAIYPDSGSKRQAVLDYIRSTDPLGATDEEIQLALSMNPSTQRPRRVELVERGLVRASERTRKTTTGRSATVWIPV